MQAKEPAMIELNEALQEALHAQKGKPLWVVDPRTQRAYVLVPAEEYEQLRPLPLPESADDIAPGIRRSKEAFLRDLPSLLADGKKVGLWTAYHGAERIGISRDSRALIRKMERRGIGEEEFYLGIIRPHEPEPEEIEPIHSHHFQDHPAEA
jgi:hypothetical protein